MNITLDRAQASDAAPISTILSDWIEETDWMPQIHGVEQQLGFGRFLLGATDVTVARSQGAVVGFLARRQQDIHSLYLAPRARGQGLGAALLDHAKKRQPHLELWTFQANDGARRFYQRAGFVEDQFTDGAGNDEKLPDVHMIWARKSL